MASVTLVSCYYKLNQSKHSLQEYDTWIKNFLLTMKASIVIFVGRNEKAYIETILSNNPHANYLLIEKEIADFQLVQKYDAAFWAEQERIDPGKWCGRGQDCFKIWNSKFNLLKEAILLNPFQSEKFIWNDIGNIREQEIVQQCLAHYPNAAAISADKLDIVLVRPFTQPAQVFFQNEVHFSGSMFGGGKEILLELCDLFYIYFDIYVKQNLFIGCDQQILATLFVKNPKKFNSILPKERDINEWFYLYKYYA